MRRVLMALLASVAVVAIADSVTAQQTAGSQSKDAQLLAVESRSIDNSADLNLIVTPSDQFYPDSTIREPMFFNNGRVESGIMGRTDASVYRANNLRSLFPIDAVDAGSSVGVYIQTNF